MTNLVLTNDDILGLAAYALTALGVTALILALDARSGFGGLEQ